MLRDKLIAKCVHTEMYLQNDIMLICFKINAF